MDDYPAVPDDSMFVAIIKVAVRTLIQVRIMFTL